MAISRSSTSCFPLCRLLVPSALSAAAAVAESPFALWLLQSPPPSPQALLDLSSWKSFSPEPHLEIPETLAVLSTEVVSLGSMPINAIQRRAVVVTNTWDLPVRFTWDLDQMRHSVGCIDGVLEVQPASGELDIGDSAICKLVYKSGLKTQVLQGEIRCWVEPTDEALEANEQIIPGATTMGAEGSQQPTMWNNGAPMPEADNEEEVRPIPVLLI